RPLLVQLQELDETSITWDEIARSESRFARSELAKYRNPIKLVMALLETRDMMRNARKRHDLAAARLRLITTEMALRCCLSENKAPPIGLELLVPQYLRRLPIDPFSGAALVYRPQGTNWLLYSIGPDGLDDGGKPISRKTDGINFGGSQPVLTNAKGDLF